MDDQRFDKLTRALAGGLSRRAALKAVTAVGFGSAMGLIGLRPARPVRAAATCQGQPYDPSSQCCTSSGVQPQTSITNLDHCPERVTNPNNVPASNGCGAGWTAYVVPDTFRDADFTTSCDHHDHCYETCNASKEACDQAFLLDLQDACDAAYPAGGDRRTEHRRVMCFRRATHYYRVVSQFSRAQTAFDDAQKKGCQCCAPQCTDCGPCDDCVDGVCQSRCGEGACVQCVDGACLSGCDPDACQVCDATAGCVSTCNPNQCEACNGQGGCATTCGADEVCENGSCVPDDGCRPCDPTQCQECDGQGACVTTCAAGEVCENGSCVPVELCPPERGGYPCGPGLEVNGRPCRCGIPFGGDLGDLGCYETYIGERLGDYVQPPSTPCQTDGDCAGSELCLAYGNRGLCGVQC